MNWIRNLWITCSIVAALSNLVLLFIFRALRNFLDDIAWQFIVTAFFIVLLNNALVAYIIIERPRGPKVVYLISAYFILKVVKNIFWVLGFSIFRKNSDNIAKLPEVVWGENDRRNKEVSNGQ